MFKYLQETIYIHIYIYIYINLNKCIKDGKSVEDLKNTDVRPL